MTRKSPEPEADNDPGPDSNHALTCSICLELFRCPIALPTCGHCFDKDCLLRSASAAASTTDPPRGSGLMIDAGAAGGALPELRIPSTAPCPLCRQPFDPLAAAEAHPVRAIADLAAAAATLCCRCASARCLAFARLPHSRAEHLVSAWPL